MSYACPQGLTLCTSKKPPIYGHGDALHFQKAPRALTLLGWCSRARQPDSGAISQSRVCRKEGCGS